MAKTKYSIRAQAVIDVLKERACVYQPAIARVLGINEGIFVSRLLFWDEKGKNPEWIWKTQEQWSIETGLSRYEQKTVRDRLKGLHIIEEKLAGVPARMHFRLNMDTMATVLELAYPDEECPSLQGHPKLDWDAATNKLVVEPQTITGVTSGVTPGVTENPSTPKPGAEGEGGSDGESGQAGNGGDGAADPGSGTAGKDAGRTGGGAETDPAEGARAGEQGTKSPDRPCAEDQHTGAGVGQHGEAARQSGRNSGDSKRLDNHELPPHQRPRSSTPVGEGEAGTAQLPPGDMVEGDGTAQPVSESGIDSSGSPERNPTPTPESNSATSGSAEQAARDKALRGTLTKQADEDRPELSKLAAFIYQEMRSWVPSGQQTKLSQGYTEILPGGNRKHHSPDVLWETDPLYPQYVQERVAYWRGQGGSPAQRRAKLVNQLCAYKGNHYAWLDWRERHVGPQVPEEEMTGSVLEAV